MDEYKLIIDKYMYIYGLTHINNGCIKINGCYVPVSNYIINMI